MRDDAYQAPELTVLGGVEELTEGGQGTGDGTGSLTKDTALGGDGV
jgi:hypothetical protein